MKILSPAGNFESLKLAIFNGADEVYLGINEFNARNNIDGFSLKQLKDAVEFAHLFDVKVNLAINILFNDKELQYALDTIVEAYNLGVDSFIIQDLALAKITHDNYPEIELHASTQMGIHNLEGVQAIQRFGFKRVVLARETPLEEIRRIRNNSNIEIEYFVQGALCVSFSGNCYLSSYECNASGNRGRCKQLCRLPYTLKKDGKPIKSGYLLSAKDFNLSTRLEDLKKAGVDVLKIEGRARRPYYVAVATKEYYNALHGKKTDNESLKLAFNRDYTCGYFDGNGSIISKYKSHAGLFVGKVEKVLNGRKFNEVYFSSNRTISPQSTLKLFSEEQEKCTISAYDLKEISNGKYKVTTTQSIFVGDNVHLIIDAELEKQILSSTKRRNINIKLFANEEQPLKAIISLENNQIEIIGDICQKANNQPITVEDLNINFNKSELFNAKLEICNLDKIFLPKQQLNKFRRMVFSKVQEAITSQHRHSLKKVKIKEGYSIKKLENFQLVEDFNDVFDADTIIYSPNTYEFQNINRFLEKCNKMNKKGYIDTPNFALEKDIELIEKIIKETGIGIVANNYYALTFDTDIIIGAGLNVYNHSTAEVFDMPIITAESDIANRVNFPLMTLRHCPMKSHLNATCAKCPYSEGFSYKMDNGKTLKLKRKKLSSCTFYLTY